MEKLRTNALMNVNQGCWWGQSTTEIEDLLRTRGLLGHRLSLSNNLKLNYWFLLQQQWQQNNQRNMSQAKSKRKYYTCSKKLGNTLSILRKKLQILKMILLWEKVRKAQEKIWHPPSTASRKIRMLLHYTFWPAKSDGNIIKSLCKIRTNKLKLEIKQNGGEVLHRMQVKEPEKSTVTTCNHGLSRTSATDE